MLTLEQRILVLARQTRGIPPHSFVDVFPKLYPFADPRSKAVVELARVLPGAYDERKIVVLQGPKGVGKTTALCMAPAILAAHKIENELRQQIAHFTEYRDVLRPQILARGEPNPADFDRLSADMEANPHGFGPEALYESARRSWSNAQYEPTKDFDYIESELIRRAEPTLNIFDAQELLDRPFEDKRWLHSLPDGLIEIDDLGREHLGDSGYYEARMFQLFNYFYANRMVLLISTNRPLRTKRIKSVKVEGFIDRYGDVIGDRLAERGIFIPIQGESLR